MGIIDELVAADGNQSALQQLADRCLETPPILHSVAEGLRTGTPAARTACMDALTRVGARRPDLLGDFINDLLDATRQPGKKIARLALDTLAAAVAGNPSAVFGEREYLLGLARDGGPMGLAAFKVLSALSGSGANYRGKLIAPLVRQLVSDAVPDKELARWLAAAAPAVEGSTDALKRLQRELEPRLERLGESERKRIDRVLAKLDRSVKRKR